MEYAVKMEGICKSFSGVMVLDHVDFALEKGKIHALVGENGAGKSTLIKILSGAYTKDEGTITIEGRPAEIHSPIDAKALGIQCIYQELSLVPHLSVASNIFLGKEGTKFGLVKQSQINREAQEMVDSLELNIDVRTEIRFLGLGEQFFTEICRCLVGNAKTVIMDEPTSAMTPNEYAQFLKTIDLLRQRGISVIYISHRLDEIFEICDAVTILRDGKIVKTASTKEITLPEMVRHMIGKDISGHLKRIEDRDFTDAEVVMCAENLCNSKLQNVSFELHKGEVLGITGLLGAGKTELASALFGADKLTAGRILMNGKPVRFHHPIHSMGKSMALVPEDRKRQGLFQTFTIRENISVANLTKMQRFRLFVDRRKEGAFCKACAKEFGVKCTSVRQPIRFLSGGNQQKVALAKWIGRQPQVLLLDEPTRGIDVGSKEEIYAIIRDMAKSGMSVLLLSSEMPEVIALSNRIIVLHDGKVKGELMGREASQESILLMATGEKL